MNIGNRYKKSKFFIMFFVSYLLLMIVTMVVGGISYVSTISTVRTSVEEYNLAMVQQASAIIDEKMLIVERTAIDIAYNNFTNVISNTKDINNGESLFNVSKLVTEIKNRKNNNGFIKGIYVFFSTPNIIVSDEGMYTPKVYHEQVVPYTNLSFEQWASLYNNDVYRGYRPAESLKYGSRSTDIITFQQPLGIYISDQSLGSVVVMIDKNYLSTLTKNISPKEEGAVLIYDTDGKLLLSVGNEEDLKVIDLARLERKYNYEAKTKNGNVVVSRSQSVNSGWKYVTVTPISIYYEKAAYVKKVVMVITLVQLILGCIVALIMSNRNYKPFKASFEKLKSLFGSQEDIGEGDYFSFIEKVTSRTLRENTEIKEGMSKVQPVLRNSLLSELLKGTVYHSEEIRENLRTVGIEFTTEFFVVSKIHIDDCSKFTKDSTIQEMALVKLVISNILEELCEGKFTVFTVDLDKEDVLVLYNLETDAGQGDYKSDADSKYRELVKLVAELRDIVADKFFIFTSIGISAAYEKVENISNACKEAEEALNYNMLREVGSIIEYKTVEHTSHSYDYTLNTELQLINFIKVGDAEKVEKVLDEIYSKNFGRSDQSLEMARCIVFDMVCTVVKVMYELHIDQKEVWGEEGDIINELSKFKNIHEMNVRVKQICVCLCEYINSNKKSHNVELREKVAAFVSEHYDENSISLLSASESLGLNSTYLSYFFKEQMGENFTSYISRLRIGKAKKLLEEGGLTLQEIAEKVGYANSGVFIKTFKKYEGCTPGKYREVLTKGNDSEIIN